MGRKRTTTGEGLIEVVARLPWWIGVLVAVFGYLILHRFAAPSATGPLRPDQLQGLIFRTYLLWLATVGQYVVPIIGIAGAVLSFVRRRQRQRLAAGVAQAMAAGALDGMSWREFEMLVGEAYRLQGYRVLETGGGGADGGVDLVLSKGSEKFLVQCKQWKAYRVGVDVVRELYGVMAARGAAGGFVVTSGRFTHDAEAFASGRNLTLVDGPSLIRLLASAKPTAQARSEAAVPPSRPAATPSKLACPSCGSEMVLRTAKRGVAVGSEFWGCSSYPKCKGTRQVS